MKPILLFVLMLFAYGTAFTQNKTQKNDSTFPEEFFIGGGVAVSSFNVTGIPSYLETNIDHKVPISPSFVVGARLYTDKKKARFFLAPEISVFSFKANGGMNFTSGLATYYVTSSYQSKLVIAPSTRIGYHLIKSAYLKWYISTGFAIDFLINASETQTINYTNAPPNIVENDPESLVFVFNLGTGIDLGKHMNLWLNYQPPADITKYTQKKSKLTSLQLGLGWRFSKGK